MCRDSSVCFLFSKGWKCYAFPNCMEIGGMKFRKEWIVGVMVVLAQGAVAELSNGLYAAFDTTMGSFTCRLDYAEAPVTCANFVGLAEGSQSWISTNGVVTAEPFYDGLLFHRVMTNFMVQGGCPLGTGTSGPGYAIPDEFSINLTHHRAGILSMANSGPDSGGSQFFITLKNTDWLDNKHAVFGEVVDGMEVVYGMGAVETDGERPIIPVVMNAVEILRVGPAALAFDPADQPLPEVFSHGLSITSGVPATVVAAGITHQCELRLFNSTNLTDWAGFRSKYFPAATSQWDQSASTNQPVEYFKAARIFYPQAVTAFTEVEGHTLSFTNASSSLIFSPVTNQTGTCSILGIPDTLSFWAEWTSAPYFGRIVFVPNEHATYQFTLSPDGTCNGYDWNGSSWQYVDTFTFTATPPE